MKLSQVCGLMWNCTDVLPSSVVDTLDLVGIELQMRTYAGAARAIKAEMIRSQQA
jgi:hypothetical protein